MAFFNSAKAEFRYGSFKFEIEDGHAVVTGYTGSESHVEIPLNATYNGVQYPVIEIGSSAFLPYTECV